MSERLQDRRGHKYLRGVSAAVIVVMTAFLLVLCLPAGPALAASGEIYACDIQPCYRHPVTGQIDDSGGENAYATGQGMVEGCIAKTGMMEKVDGGSWYLTIRMGLVDYTTDQTFQVQEWGSTEWSDPAVGITGQGSDDNGTTYDITMEVPSDTCVVRGSMYVQPMGRSVIFFLYPENLAPSSESGGANGMKAMMVTSASAAGAEAGGASEGGGKDGNDSASETVSTSEADGTAGAGDEGKENENVSKQEDARTLQKSVLETQQAAAQNDSPAASGSSTGGVDSKAGLNLSTEKGAGQNAGAQENLQKKTSSAAADGSTDALDTASVRPRTIAEQIVINIISWSVTGLILIAAIAILLVFFRKNWKRWGGEDPDDYSGLYRENKTEDDAAFCLDSSWYEEERTGKNEQQ